MSARLIPLDRATLKLAIALERDAVTREKSNLAIASLDYAWACIDGGILIGAGGLALVWPGRAEAWALVTELARPRQIVAGFRLARAWLDEIARDPRFKRIEMYVREDRLYDFIFALGFSREKGFSHFLEAWGPDGGDYIMYERIHRGN
jgi:hypothetical protein